MHEAGTIHIIRDEYKYIYIFISLTLSLSIYICIYIYIYASHFHSHFASNDRLSIIAVESSCCSIIDYRNVAMALQAEIQKLIDQALSSQDARIVPIYAEIVELGLKCGLLYKRKAPSKTVGVHRGNREGEMVSGSAAHTIWDEVDRVGVCPDLFKDATSFEEPQSRINETKFLERCATDKLLREYKLGDIQLSSVACSHWNQAIGAAEDGMATFVTTMREPNIHKQYGRSTCEIGNR